MTDDFPFLRTIAENPDDDGPRLVFADWLEERGDPYAEFIRLQCQLEHLAADAPEAETMRKRAAELFRANWREWLTPVCDALDDYSPLEAASTSAWLPWALSDKSQRWLAEASQYRWGYLRGKGTSVTHNVKTWEGEEVRLKEATFSRGFADGVTIAAYGPLNRDNLLRLQDCSPLRHLKLSWTKSREWAKFDGPHLATLRRLSLQFSRHTPTSSSVRQSEVVRAVCASRHLERLSSLCLEDREETSESLRSLANSGRLHQLDELRIVSLDDSTMEELLRTRVFQQLRRLEFGNNGCRMSRPKSSDDSTLQAGLEELVIRASDYDHDPAHHARFFFETSVASNLRFLSFHTAYLPGGMWYLAQSAQLATLRELELWGVLAAENPAVVDRALSSLFNSTHLCELQSLFLKVFNSPQIPYFDALRNARGMLKLKTISLHWKHAGDRIAQALVRGPLAARLKTLDLSNCTMTNTGGEALAKSPKLEKIESLRLTGNDLDERTRKKLIQRFGHRVSF